MSEKQFKERLEKIKADVYGQTFQDIKTKEKFYSQKQKLLKMIIRELEKVEEVFEHTGIPEESPNINLNYQGGVALTFPIVRHSTRYVSNMNFNLMRTKEGYGVQIKWIGHEQFLAPPVKKQQLEKKIIEYIKQRSAQIKKIEKKYTHTTLPVNDK